MRASQTAVFAAAAMLASTGMAAARDKGNARAGRIFADYNCESCHIISADQELRPLLGGVAPGFAVIANRSDTTPETLRAFLSRSHAYSNMPYPDLTAPDLANVVAYILSLRRPPGARETHEN